MTEQFDITAIRLAGYGYCPWCGDYDALRWCCGECADCCICDEPLEVSRRHEKSTSLAPSWTKAMTEILAYEVVPIGATIPTTSLRTMGSMPLACPSSVRLGVDATLPRVPNTTERPPVGRNCGGGGIGPDVVTTPKPNHGKWNSTISTRFATCRTWQPQESPERLTPTSQNGWRCGDETKQRHSIAVATVAFGPIQQDQSSCDRLRLSPEPEFHGPARKWVNKIRSRSWAPSSPPIRRTIVKCAAPKHATVAATSVNCGDTPWERGRRSNRRFAGMQESNSRQVRSTILRAANSYAPSPQSTDSRHRDTQCMARGEKPVGVAHRRPYVAEREVNKVCFSEAGWVAPNRGYKPWDKAVRFRPSLLGFATETRHMAIVQPVYQVACNTAACLRTRLSWFSTSGKCLENQPGATIHEPNGERQ